MSKWKVHLIGHAKRNYKKLPLTVKGKFALLLIELKNGPEMPKWKNYSKLGAYHYHCHIKKGNPTYVVCWSAHKKDKIIEVYYAGTHQNAPY